MRMKLKTGSSHFYEVKEVMQIINPHKMAPESW